MLAVKAKYENGTVRWERKPPVEGLCDLIVVFLDVPDAERTESEVSSFAVRAKSEEGLIG